MLMSIDCEKYSIEIVSKGDMLFALNIFYSVASKQWCFFQAQRDILTVLCIEFNIIISLSITNECKQQQNDNN